MNTTSTWTDLIGLDAETMVDKLVAKGVSKYDAARLINNLIAVNLHQSPRHFSFSSPLPTGGACAPTFARSFSHQDWVDGESVVQAGESADDKGFNWRFNALAADIDALHADTVRLFNCLSTLREELVGALQDVAAELNRIDNDIAGLTTKVPPKEPWHFNVVDAPQFLGVRELDGNKVTMWKTAGNVVVLPGVDTVALQDTVAQRLSTGGLLLRFADANQQFAKDLSSGTTVTALITKYGNHPLGDGRTVAQALTVLAGDAKYSTPQAMVDAVNGQEQAFLRSTVGSVDAVGAVVGVTSEGSPLSEVSPTAIANAVAGASSDLGPALGRAGLATVKDVAGLSATQLVSRLGKQGVRLTTAQASELKTRASMIAGFEQ